MFIFIKINSMWTNQFIFTKNNYNYITMYSLFNILILMIYNIDFILFLHYQTRSSFDFCIRNDDWR